MGERCIFYGSERKCKRPAMLDNSSSIGLIRILFLTGRTKKLELIQVVDEIEKLPSQGEIVGDQQKNWIDCKATTESGDLLPHQATCNGFWSINGKPTYRDKEQKYTTVPEVIGAIILFLGLDKNA